MRSSKAELPVTLEGDGFVFREIVWGGMHVEISTFDKEFDEAPLLKGLSNDLSPAPTWGYVLKGRFSIIYKNSREEVFTTGDVFYAEPMHRVIVEAGSECVTFSPEMEVMKTTAVMERYLAAMQQK